MPTPRRILGVLDGNIKKRRELTPKKRGAIVGARLCGVAATKVARVLKVPITTVYSTEKADLLRVEGFTRPRSGRPIEYSDREVRALYDMYAKTRRRPMPRSIKGWVGNETLKPSGVCLSLLA
jgi:hypothetical protein